jgi:ferredoxin-NADP reductase
MSNSTHYVRVHAVCEEAEGVKRIELRPEATHGALPVFTAGAHIDLHLPNGIVRSYSLMNSQAECNRYVIGVYRVPEGRGGSAWIFDHLKVGDRLAIGAPRNNFVLAEDAPHSVLIAGGIGVTPLLCMARRLTALGRPWKLHYATRTRRNAGFLDALAELEAKCPGSVQLNFDHEPGGQMLDLQALVNASPTEVHLYCCGPDGMLRAFEAATAGRPQAQVHVEHFSPAIPAVQDGGFTVVLRQSNREIAVPAGKTILDALLDEGIEVPCSCMEGTCGSCETRVLEGEPDHRDVVLNAVEKAANDRMMICCSGSRSRRLVLDI